MPGGLDNFAVQQDILAYIQTSLPSYSVESGGIPNGDSLPLVNGALQAYIILRFADTSPTPNGGSFGGPKHDEYFSVFDALCVAPTDTQAREVGNYLDTFLLSHKLTNTGSITRAPGSQRFALYSDASRQPVAFVVSKAYRYSTNISEVGEF